MVLQNLEKNFILLDGIIEELDEVMSKHYEFSTISHGLSNFSITTSDQFRALKLGIVPLGYRKFEVKPFDFEDFFSSLDIPTLNFIGEKDNLITLDHSL
ncbi:unnamed protein product [Rhizophagus irregularis]|uniref:Uncharacterized protein n=1 Tax=Rhizophagus irregularis TaxID=588596 RepID=A0A916EDP7_9GLOM|nr:alpha/beta hydrolase protein [Rhizophagus irregularis DAOM 181602=DAOM 197198]CAB5380126.1 unnamed protein product [Rhizophagus irregularis]